MLKIKLKRSGCKKKPFYKIVLATNLSKNTGKEILILGYYNPLNKNLKINKVNLIKYINLGAYPTNTVRHLIYKII